MEEKARGRRRPDLSVDEFLDRLASLADDRMFSEHHAEAMLDTSLSMLREERLELARLEKEDPAEAERRKKDMVPWVRVGANGVRYRLGDLRDYQRQRRFGGKSLLSANDDSMFDMTGVGYAVGRLAEGILPFAIVAGQPMDFIDTADSDEVERIDWMVAEQAAFIREIDARIDKP